MQKMRRMKENSNGGRGFFKKTPAPNPLPRPAELLLIYKLAYIPLC